MSGIHTHLRAVALLALTAFSGPVLAGGAGSCQLPCDFEMTEIDGPVIPPLGEMNLTLRAVNDAGVAVGEYHYLSGNGHPCIWTEEGGVVAIPKPAGVGFGYAVGINNNGWIIANTESSVGKRGWVLIPHESGFTWVPLAPTSSEGWSFVGGINDLNQVVGWHFLNNDTPYRGFFWSVDSGFLDVIPDGWMSSRCTDINNHGVICGNVSMSFQASPSSQTVRAFTLNDGVITIIEPPAPFTMSEVRRINDSEVVVGNVLTPGGGGVSWQSSGMLHSVADATTILINPPPGYTYVSLEDLNEVSSASGALMTSTGYVRPGVTCGVSILDLTLGLPTSVANNSNTGLAIGNDGRVFVDCAGKPVHLYSPLPNTPDLDCDGIVGSSDLGLLMTYWGTSGPADLDGDSTVGGRDLGILLSAWSS